MGPAQLSSAQDDGVHTNTITGSLSRMRARITHVGCVSWLKQKGLVSSEGKSLFNYQVKVSTLV